MKILIDTSYFLPLIKVAIKKIPKDLLIKLLSTHIHKYFYSNLSIFELTAKGLKLSSQKEKGITSQDVRVGIDAIQQDFRLIKISYIDNPLIIELASLLRSIHKDTIDCLIFASAICNCDCIITMDVSFFDEINENKPIVEKIQKINENFRFWFNDLSKDYKSLELKDAVP